MPRASKVCSIASCPELQPCPVPGHTKQPWQGSRRRDRLRKRSGSRQQKLARFVMLRDEGRCHICGEYGANEVDHVVPLSAGGEDHIDNLKAIHKEPCHAEKTRQEARRGREGRLEVAVFALVGLPAAGKTTVRVRLAQEFDVPTMTIDAEANWTDFLKRIERTEGIVIAESNIVPPRYRVLLSTVPSRIVEVVAPLEERERRLKARNIMDLDSYLTPHSLAPQNVDAIGCDDYAAMRRCFEGLLSEYEAAGA